MRINLTSIIIFILKFYLFNCLYPEDFDHDIYDRPVLKYVREHDDPLIPSNPVIFVPGFGGSQLEAKLTNKPSRVHYLCDTTTSDYYDIWLDLKQFVTYFIDCFVDNMRMVINKSTRKCENSPGVDIRTPGNFGNNTDVVEWLDTVHFSQASYFAPIANALVSWGYIRGKNIQAAPYDWRLKPTDMEDYYLKLKQVIIKTSELNNNSKVVFIAHSMGNVHLNYFLRNYVDKPFIDKYIQSHIALAAPWAGSMQIVKLLVSGYNMEFYRILLPPSSLRSMQRTWGSSYLLFPREPAWKKDEVFAFGPYNNYSLNNVKDFFKDLNFMEGYDQYVESLTNTYKVMNVPDVETHCINGVGIDTPDIYGWSKSYYPDYQPDYSKIGDGDGTVNKKSLDICRMWSKLSPIVTVNEVNKTDHISILSSSVTIKLIKEKLYKNMKY
uniref:Lecithin:cholesterol acyltransferase family protein n=1 Tax=Parastrongyloides trichosuri TaxID=131310 RepID=A0A0N4ZSF3_PARTI